jgi:hypothetical protein
MRAGLSGVLPICPDGCFVPPEEDAVSVLGIALDSLAEPLKRVSVHLDRKPVLSFDAAARIGPHALAYAQAHYGTRRPFLEVLHDLPLHAFARLSADELCKIRQSSVVMMHTSVERAFEEHPVLNLVRKIGSSMWRWGVRRALWNETVDAYDGIRAFDVGLPGFSATLDFTTGYNPRGYSQFSRTFLDGVFGFLVHHGGRHVMTVGFSLSTGRNLLLQQVQLTQRRGNRWLYSLPSGRMEFVVDRLRAAFPRHRIMVADGGSVASVNLRSYQNGIEEVSRRLEWNRQRQDGPDTADYIASLEADHAEIVARHSHLLAEASRIAAFYRDTGRHIQGRCCSVNGVEHYMLAA